jgi:hypothetical protein
MNNRLLGVVIADPLQGRTFRSCPLYVHCPCFPLVIFQSKTFIVCKQAVNRPETPQLTLINQATKYLIAHSKSS